ncbi:MAG: hypothetical protein EBW14_21575, partial [Oxalobacteraceae bacterium]|nr:hypothetical protein [Oxalobacteraceae bacterium]
GVGCTDCTVGDGGREFAIDVEAFGARTESSGARLVAAVGTGHGNVCGADRRGDEGDGGNCGDEDGGERLPHAHRH